MNSIAYYRCTSLTNSFSYDEMFTNAGDTRRIPKLSAKCTASVTQQ